MKMIKILFWKILQWYNEVAIKMSENDLKLFEKRLLFIEKHLKKLGAIDNSDLDDFDINSSYPEGLIQNFDKDKSTNIHELFEERKKNFDKKIKELKENKNE